MTMNHGDQRWRGESARAYAAFGAYRDLGSQRNLAAAWQGLSPETLETQAITRQTAVAECRDAAAFRTMDRVVFEMELDRTRSGVRRQDRATEVDGRRIAD